MHHRHTQIDALKALAAQGIVLHHLSAYGPIAEATRDAAPRIIDWLFDYARMAVMIFLVVGGYLAASALTGRAARAVPALAPTLLRRYLRLILPFLAALALSIACSAVARLAMSDDMPPAAPTPGQILAHALLLYDVLGYESLITGAWYVAIDFQLYALLALILALCRVWRPLPLTLVSLLGVASLFVFNRDPGLDNLAIFYFGAYAMGAAAYWSAHSRHPALWLALMAGLVASSLFFDFRWRIAISLAVALLLGAARPRCLPLPFVRLFAYLGRTSYSLFLVHFPVYLLTSVLFSLSGQRSPALGMASFTLTWVASLILAHHFHQLVERPCGHLLGRLQGITLKGRS